MNQKSRLDIERDGFGRIVKRTETSNGVMTTTSHVMNTAIC